MAETVIVWPTEVDMSNSGGLEDQLHAAFNTADADDTVVIDLAPVEFADSPALGVLIAAHGRSLETGVALILQDTPPAVRKTISITGLDGMFTHRARA